MAVSAQTIFFHGGFPYVNSKPPGPKDAQSTSSPWVYLTRLGDQLRDQPTFNVLVNLFRLADCVAFFLQKCCQLPSFSWRKPIEGQLETHSFASAGWSGTGPSRRSDTGV
jgi:hypothetical protein